MKFMIRKDRVAFLLLSGLLLTSPVFAQVCDCPCQNTPNPAQMTNQSPAVPIQSYNEPPIFIQIDKPEYGLNEQIRLRFKASPTFSSSAWIGILDAAYPHGDASENDRHDINYQYLKSRLSGDMVFAAPTQPGTYDFRLNDGDREYYAVPFKVVDKSFVHQLPGVSLALNKTNYTPGETIKVSFQSAPELSSSAWIGLLDAKYPHGNMSENDKHDLAYQYLQSRMAGEVTFKAPLTPGKYDFRLNDGGREFFTVPFVVSRPPATKPKPKNRV